MKVVLASGNPGKLRELTRLLHPSGFEIVAQSALGIAPPLETGSTFMDNALLKARHAAQAARLPALADDSGIEVAALQGRPGVFSARFAGEGASDQENVRKLLAELNAVPGAERRARYRCVIAYVRSEHDLQPLLAEGLWEGVLAHAPRGAHGFGYDPIFIPLGSSCTAAEMTVVEKNLLSHRAQALQLMLAKLQQLHD